MGYHQRERTETSIETSPEQCMEIIRTKMCHGEPMNCIDGNCYFNIDPIYTFHWLSWREFKSIHCTVNQQIISGTNLNSTLHTGATSSCKAHDYYCLLGNNVVIWTNEIIHSCPYNYIETIEFSVEKDVYFSDSARLALRRISITKECGFDMIETAEGLYLSINDTVKSYIDVLMDINKIDDLILSEIDYNQYASEFTSYKILNQLMCTMFRMQILMHMRMSHGFFRILTIYEHELILYNDRGRLLVPTCVKISSFELIVNTELCYEFVPVSFKYNDVLQFAFLNENGILSKTSLERDCKFDKFIRVYNMDYYIELVGKLNKLQHMSNVEISKLHLQKFDMAKLNFHHDVKILEGVDLVSNLKLLNRIEELEHVFYVQDSVVINKEVEPAILNQENVFIKDLASYFNNNFIGKKVKNVLIIILTIFAFAVLVIIYLYMIKPIILRIRTNRSKRRTHVNLDQLIQMNQFPWNS